MERPVGLSFDVPLSLKGGMRDSPLYWLDVLVIDEFIPYTQIRSFLVNNGSVSDRSIVTFEDPTHVQKR